MARIIDYNELDSLLANMVAKAQTEGTEAQASVFSTLYNHGFRVREVLYSYQWDDLGNGQIKCKTSKGSLDRIIPVSELDYFLLDGIYKKQNNYVLPSYSTYLRYFGSNKAVLQYFVNGARIGTHIFRHNYIKRLNAEGLNIEQIKNATGLLSNEVANGYLNSVISVNEI